MEMQEPTVYLSCRIDPLTHIPTWEFSVSGPADSPNAVNTVIDAVKKVLAGIKEEKD